MITDWRGRRCRCSIGGNQGPLATLGITGESSSFLILSEAFPRRLDAGESEIGRVRTNAGHLRPVTQDLTSLLRLFETIADATQGLEIARMPGVGFDLLAQSAHIDIDGAWGDERGFFPDGIEQLVAGEHATEMTCQIFQQAELAHRGENR